MLKSSRIKVQLMAENERKTRSTIKFACGTDARITSLNQSATYEGLLEGYPNSDMNARLVQRMVADIEKRTGDKPYLIQPTETPKPQEFPIGRRPWMALPSIECEASLYSSSFGEFGSSLTICWYQDDFAFPIAPEVFDELRLTQWREHARPHDDF